MAPKRTQRRNGERVDLRHQWPHQSLQTTEREAKRHLTSHWLCSNPKEGRYPFILFSLRHRMAIRERMLFLLSSQWEQRKNVSIFHSSPPTLGHQCDFLLSQKLLNLLLDLSTNKKPNLILSGQTWQKSNQTKPPRDLQLWLVQ